MAKPIKVCLKIFLVANQVVMVLTIKKLKHTLK